jgi:predicted RNA-binding protein with PIN domain
MTAKRILLVDGYNVINRVPELKDSLDGGLQNARNQLALRVSIWSHEHPAVECVIVFDGDLQYSGGRDQRLAGIRCIFSLARHGGDAELIRFVRDYRGRKSDITVVSDDNNVSNNCRAHSAVVQPSGFIMIRKVRSSGARDRSTADGKGIDRKAAADINAEMKKKFGLQ